ncbi:FeoB-associated Cys-rich membrane protein [Flavobacterium luteum]|uniref:FeoB-associated Cys-rich membrane protein n=1 Tax=Flavobacterium luteum TaxID=2026654 RepID=A0A7J5AH94_9FLAO|nr:FeoB-associated Cys-rich membrane protein [Flavobacterium luteum]KAB1156987.1 FeoB-associated Cys-rich membrane protein [Flavobacterium luteum]
MSFQEIVVFIIVGFALAYLIRKFIWKPKSNKNCGNDDCGCH